jgi:hypothetical protein
VSRSRPPPAKPDGRTKPGIAGWKNIAKRVNGLTADVAAGNQTNLAPLLQKTLKNKGII